MDKNICIYIERGFQRHWDIARASRGWQKLQKRQHKNYFKLELETTHVLQFSLFVWNANWSVRKINKSQPQLGAAVQNKKATKAKKNKANQQLKPKQNWSIITIGNRRGFFREKGAPNRGGVISRGHPGNGDTGQQQQQQSPTVALK